LKASRTSVARSVPSQPGMAKREFYRTSETVVPETQQEAGQRGTLLPSATVQPKTETASMEMDGAFEEALLRVGFSIARFARGLGLSLRQFEREFREEFQCCPREVIQNIRMTLAYKRLLSEASLKEISAQLGYCDPAHFSRAFCNFYGASPLQMRRNLLKKSPKSTVTSQFSKRLSRFGK